MAEKKMKNPCWKGYEAYGMKKKNGKEVPNCVPVKEETEVSEKSTEEAAVDENQNIEDADQKTIKEATKRSIVSAVLESHMKDGPGKGSQRPKSWNKGTKSGSEKRKMREQGKREAREINEEQKDWPFGWGTEAANTHNSLVIRASEFLGDHFMMAPIDGKPVLHAAAGGTPFKSHEEIIPVVNRIIDAHAAKTAEFLKKEGRTPTAGWADGMKAKFAKLITPPKSDPVPERKPDPLAGFRRIPYDGTDAARDARLEREYHIFENTDQEMKKLQDAMKRYEQRGVPIPSKITPGVLDIYREAVKRDEETDKLVAASGGSLREQLEQRLQELQEEQKSDILKRLNHEINSAVHGHHGAVQSLVGNWKQGLLTAEEAMKQIHAHSTQTAATVQELRDQFNKHYEGN